MSRWSFPLVFCTLAACGGRIEVAPTFDLLGPSVDLTAHDLASGDLANAPTPDLAPPAFSFKDWIPPSRGIWIWYWDYIGMTPAEAAQKCQDLGVGYVLIKSGQDGKQWTDRFNADAVAEFTTRGMHVLGWPYITPTNIPASIDAAVAAANIPGVDGLVLDVEVEWEQNGDHSQAATELCQGIRKGAPQAFLGYTSFGWVGYHITAFPFEAFDADCGDAYFAQVYFSDRGTTWNGDKGLQQALDMYAAAKLKAPLWIAVSNDDIAGTTDGPTTKDLNDSMAAAGPRVSLWEFPGKSWPEKLTQLDNLVWTN